MKDLLNFNRMIAPYAIQVLFWISVIICIVTGFANFFSPHGSAVTGILTLVLGPIAVRVIAELWMVIFKIYEALLDIRESLSQR